MAYVRTHTAHRPGCRLSRERLSRAAPPGTRARDRTCRRGVAGARRERDGSEELRELEEDSEIAGDAPCAPRLFVRARFSRPVGACLPESSEEEEDGEENDLL